MCRRGREHSRGGWTLSTRSSASGYAPFPLSPPSLLGQKTRLVFLLHMPALLELASVKVCKLILGCGCVQLESLQSKTDEKVDAILELLKQKKTA